MRPYRLALEEGADLESSRSPLIRSPPPSRYRIKEDDLVAIQMGRSIGMVVAMVGVLMSGGAYVPVDPTYPTGQH